MNDMEKEKPLGALQGANSASVIKEVSDAFSDVATAEDFLPHNDAISFLHHAVLMLSSLPCLVLISANPEKGTVLDCGSDFSSSWTKRHG